MFSAVSFLVSLVFSTEAIPYDPHSEAVARTLPRGWYHPRSHPVHPLFRRASSAVPGSPEWRAQYPTATLPPISEAQVPPAWLAALSAAEQAGKIPNISVAVPTGGNPTYPDGGDPAGPIICSSTWQCRGEGDIWDAPDGHVGVGFDDGPENGSKELYQFLQQQNQSATHFMIGVNILNQVDLFNEAFSTLQNDIGVHTWTHPYMTTQNNTQVVAQLGWTMQIIHDLTGGRVPRYWRPPYGDSDNRVRAIAREVFNITQIDWNHDSADWTISTGGSTRAKVEASLNQWYSGPKSPGLIILEHELTPDTSGAFIDTYPTLKSNGWTPTSVISLFDGAWQNADDNEGLVESMEIGGTAAPLAASTSTAVVSSTDPSADSTASTPSAPRGSGSFNSNNGNTSGSLRIAPSPFLALVGMLALQVSL